MDYFGINSADDLPKIKEVLMEELVEATKVSTEEAEQVTEEETSETKEEPVAETEE